MAILIGQYESRIDAKSRVAFPKSFRTFLGDKLVITLGYENSLIIVSQRQWKALLEGTESRPFIEFETREIQRFLLGGAQIIELDSKGRFVLSGSHRQYARIETEVAFIGLNRRIEVWDKVIWERHREKLSLTVAGISERLTEKGEGRRG